MSVVIYSTRCCGYCVLAKELLKRKGIAFEEVMVDDDPARRVEMKERCGRGSVPQIFFGEHHVGGFDALYALDRAGSLDGLLERN